MSLDPDLLNRALASLRDARQRLECHEAGRREPLAIVGMSCRFPGGASGHSRYWSLLVQGLDGVVGTPPDRWPAQQAAQLDERSRKGGFISDIDLFDAEFFGIAPREAGLIDPQQRIFLMTAVEALEDAGMSLEASRGGCVGVWAGVNSNDYFQLQTRAPRYLDTYSVVGGAGALVANRLSYQFDFRGPSMAVDTACSTGLVVTHLACQSLRDGETDMAIVGAVNLMLSPFSSLAHAKGLPMAADARCKTFDDRADGYVRGEGCGVLVLKRLSDAIRDDDSIWALMRGSAVNQDGRTNGLTAPNGLAQREVIQRALRNAGVAPGSVGLVETHGTGTALGDPIEVEAIQAVYGSERSTPCALGAVKTNIGHLEAAAGLAGTIKAALCLHAGAIPKNLHFERCNPHIELDDGAFTIPTTLRPWSAGTRRAAVSSFGAGGTNAHLVMEQPPPISQDREATPRELCALFLTAGSPDSLLATAQRWRTWLNESPEAFALEDACYTSVHRRGRRKHGSVILASNRPELEAGLAALVNGETSSRVAVGEVGNRSGKTVFVFPGQGSQWRGMAVRLLEFAPFRAAFTACDRAIEACVGWSVLAQIRDDPPPRRFDEIDVIQPALWALSLALAAQWRSWGVLPDAVLGHSMGEVAAATVSGSLTLDDAARIICTRSALLRRTSGQGLMLLIGLPMAEVSRRIEAWRAEVSVAVNNSPMTTVISGAPEAVKAIESSLGEDGIFFRRVNVDVASHSPQMDALRAELMDALAGIDPQRPSIPSMSTVHADWVTDKLTPAYWADNLREPVRFAEAVALLLDDGCTTFIEMSAHPILLSAIEETADGSTSADDCFDIRTVPSMRRDTDGREVVRQSWATLFASGSVQPHLDFVPDTGRVLRTPTPEWDLSSYWFCAERETQPSASATEHDEGPLVSRRDASADTARGSWIKELSRMDASLYMPEIERRVTCLVSTILRMPQRRSISPSQGFFTMGMDSIMAVELCRKLGKALEKRVPTSVVFENPTIRRLSAYVLGLVDSSSSPIAVPAADEVVPTPPPPAGPTEQLSESELLKALTRELEIPA